MKHSRRRKIGIVMLLVLVLAGGGWFFRPGPPFVPIEPFVQFLPPDARIPAQPATVFDRWVPIRWSWLWRLRDHVRGPLAGILIDTKILECAPRSEQELTELLSKPPLAETNGLRAWILDDANLAAVSLKLETQGGRLVSRPRVQTSHGIQASLSVGSALPLGPGTQVGLSLDLLPLIQRDGAEMITIFTVTEAATNALAVAATASGASGTAGVSIRTNLATAARWRVRDGTGFFLLGPVPSNDTPRLGVIVSATITRPKK